MLRRSFLSLIPGIAALAARGRSAAAAPSPKPLLLQTSPLAGFQYHAGEAVWALLAPGTSLQLVREPRNPHDPHAVRVEWNGHKLGYIPRLQNHTVAQLLDRGAALSASIVELQNSTDPWQRVEFSVFLAA